MLAFFMGFAFGRFVSLNGEPPSPDTPRWIGNRDPDPLLFNAVRVGLVNWRSSKANVLLADWSIHEDPGKGLIETGWFRTHKGEVELKCQIVTWGQLYRVDVWQKFFWTGALYKTWWSRVTEKEIQEEIEKAKQHTANFSGMFKPFSSTCPS
jgi:hypothetical protein